MVNETVTLKLRNLGQIYSSNKGDAVQHISDFQLYLFHKTYMGSDILTIQIII